MVCLSSRVYELYLVLQIQFPLYVLDGGTEQRVAVKFCFKAGQSATELLVQAQKDYGNEALNRSNVFRWYSRFRDDDERGGHPESTRKEVNSTVVVHLVKMTFELHEE